MFDSVVHTKDVARKYPCHEMFTQKTATKDSKRDTKIFQLKQMTGSVFPIFPSASSLPVFANVRRGFGFGVVARNKNV